MIEYDEFMDAVDAAGLPDDAATFTYSGRAMFGARCPGITVGSMSEAFEFFAGLGSANPEAARELASVARTDNMGLGVIVYFPGCEVEGAPATGP